MHSTHRITSNSNIFSEQVLFLCLFVFRIQFAYASHFQLNVFLRFIFLIIIFSDSFPTSFFLPLSFPSDWFYWADAPNRFWGNVFSVPYFVFHVKSRFFIRHPPSIQTSFYYIRLLEILFKSALSVRARARWVCVCDHPMWFASRSFVLFYILFYFSFWSSLCRPRFFLFLFFHTDTAIP